MRILLVDNGGDLIDRMIDGMDQSFVVDAAYNSDDGGYLSQVNDYDAVTVGPSVLDSERNELCLKARSSNTTVPIAVITSEDSPEKRISALNSGADVCIKYPVSPPELNAQLRALIRRNSLCPNPITSVGNISLNSSQRKVSIGGRTVPLRKKEYEILEFLIMNRGKVVSKEMLLEHVWNNGLYIFTNIIEVHIRNIRLALREFTSEKIIKTVKGFGYIMEG
jgi:DNA-binding response OmpR family regulator